jgi:hypothetical protein
LTALVRRPSGTVTSSPRTHHAFDLADYAEVTAEKIQPLLDRLSGPQACILRGTGAGRYEIYHDVLAAAILDWRTRYLQAIRGARQRRRFVFLLCLSIGGFVADGFRLSSVWLIIAGSIFWLSGLGVLVMIAARLWARRARRQS